MASINQNRHSSAVFLLILAVSSSVFAAPAKNEKNVKSRDLVALDTVQKNTGIVSSGTPIILADAGSAGISSGGQATQAILLTTSGGDTAQAVAVPVTTSVTGQSQVTNINTYKTQ